MVEKQDIPDDPIDALLAKYEKPDDLLGRNGILEQLTKRVVERALEAEMTHHLGHEKHGRVLTAASKVACDLTPEDFARLAERGKNVHMLSADSSADHACH